MLGQPHAVELSVQSIFIFHLSGDFPAVRSSPATLYPAFKSQYFISTKKNIWAGPQSLVRWFLFLTLLVSQEKSEHCENEYCFGLIHVTGQTLNDTKKKKKSSPMDFD